MASENDDDVDVEAQWYDELAGAFESLAPEYRRAAGLLRLTRGALRPGDLEQLREQLRRLTRRVLDAVAAGEGSLR